MISSILENDYYKFKMGNFMFHHGYDDLNVTFRLIDRGGTLPNNKDFVHKINEEVEKLSQIRWSKSKLDFLFESFKSQSLTLSPCYREYLKDFYFDPKRVKVEIRNDKLFVSITAPWPEVSMWEVPLMAIVSELYTIENDFLPTYEEVDDKFTDFVSIGIPLVDFGLRRRSAQNAHETIVRRMHRARMILGTSNAHIALRCAIEPMGSMAHELFMVLAATRKPPIDTTREVLEEWIETYPNGSQFALADTFGFDSFFASFNKELANAYAGVRHDSGDPITFAERMIAHYEKLGIVPITKTIVFSDALKGADLKAIAKKLNGKIRVLFGVGTNLTNNFGIHKRAPNFVIKPFYAEGMPVVKLSGIKEKATGEINEIKRYERMFEE
jgi:nicotinate phosphoribosyltransferase